MHNCKYVHVCIYIYIHAIIIQSSLAFNERKKERVLVKHLFYKAKQIVFLSF